jgi:homoserine O-succinyltransferase
LQVTEQQFMRLVGSSNQIAQIYVHPFSVPGLPRSLETQAYIDEYYTTFNRLQHDGLDALIITGANVTNPHLELEPFWEPLTTVMAWAAERVSSVLCSCLATHSLMKHTYKIDRQLLPQKHWGVFAHRVSKPDHPLLRDINTRFDVPHSRYNTITQAQFENAGLTILIESPDNEVHMAVSPDQFRNIYLQGHPEYHTNSLLKEYKREVLRYLNSERERPPFPANYFVPEVQALADAYLAQAERAQQAGDPIPEFPEDAIFPLLDNTWSDTGKAIFNNWLGLVYRLTHVDRDKLFMPGVDPENPLGLL